MEFFPPNMENIKAAEIQTDSLPLESAEDDATEFPLPMESSSQVLSQFTLLSSPHFQFLLLADDFVLWIRFSVCDVL